MPLGTKIVRSILLAVALMMSTTPALANDYLLAPAPASCPPSQTAQAPTAKITSRTSTLAPISTLDRAKLSISAKDAVEAAEQALIVDVRSGQDTARFWIPNAIHVFPDFLQTNALVRNAHTVFLVGDGKNESSVLPIARGLQRNGKNFTRIVIGGMRAWRAAGGVIDGDVALLDAPAVLDAKEFHDLTVQGVTVLMIGRPSPAERKILPTLTALPADIPASAALLQSRVALRQKPTVLLLRGSEKVAEWNNAWLDAFHQEPLIFIDVGNRYTSFLGQQKQIADNAGKPLQHRCDVH